MAYRSTRTVTTPEGLCQLLLSIRRCHHPECARYHQPYRPEEEGRWALPHGEFGLDVVAFIGTLRYERHRSVPEIHQALCKRGVLIAERTVTNLLARYARVSDPPASATWRVYVSVSPLKDMSYSPWMAYSPMWGTKSCGCCATISEVWFCWLGASSVRVRPTLLYISREGQPALPVPIHGVISDGQHAIRNAVHSVLPEVPHQLCHFHDLREAAKPIYEADRHAKKELKQHIRGVRPIERTREHRQDTEAEVIRG